MDHLQVEKQLLDLEVKVSPESKTKIVLVHSELKETLIMENRQRIKE